MSGCDTTQALQTGGWCLSENRTLQDAGRPAAVPATREHVAEAERAGQISNGVTTDEHQAVEVRAKLTASSEASPGSAQTQAEAQEDSAQRFGSVVPARRSDLYLVQYGS